VFGNRSGRVRLVIPLTPLQPWMARLTEPRDADRPDDEIDPPPPRPTAEREQALVDVVVTLAKSRIRTRDLFDLEVGDLITTEQDVTAPLELSLQGVPKFTVRAGALRGNKAVRIEGLITE
jgi:flagellar motor switch protein FliM